MGWIWIEGGGEGEERGEGGWRGVLGAAGGASRRHTGGEPIPCRRIYNVRANVTV